MTPTRAWRHTSFPRLRASGGNPDTHSAFSTAKDVSVLLMLGWVQGQESQTSITVIQLHTFCLQLRVNFLKYNFYPCSKNPQLPQRPDHIKSRSLCLNNKAFYNPTHPIHLLPSQPCVLLPVPGTASLTCLWATAQFSSLQCPLLLLSD